MDEVSFAFLEEPPFCFSDSNGRVGGCDVELARAVLQRLGYALRPVSAEFSDLLPGLVDGRWAMTTGLFVTAERQKIAAFTRPIWSLPDGLLVAKGNPNGIVGYRALRDMPNLLLGVVADQVQHATAMSHGFAPNRIKVFATQAAAAAAVADGVVAAYASVAMAHRGYLLRHPGAELSVVEISGAEKEPAFGAFALRQDSPLLEPINAFLDAFLGSEEHHAIMVRADFHLMTFSVF